MILGTKSTKFDNRQVKVYRREAIEIETAEKGMAFFDMMKLRNPVSPNVMKVNMLTKGHLFANMGVSVTLTTTIQNTNYLMTAKQTRPDFRDTVLKPVSGYIEANHLDDLTNAMDEEISEEFLPCTKSKMIRGLRELKPLPQPFTDYETKFAYQVYAKQLYTLPDLADKVIFKGKEIDAGIYFHAPTNSAQLVYACHVELPLETYAIHHCEDEYNKEEDRLDMILHEHGIYLIELDNDLTDKVFTFKEGKLEASVEQHQLSEAFIPKCDNIALFNHISLSNHKA